MLLELEATLQNFKFWQENSISIEDVTTPFGVGQIEFVEWLQFIYIPKMMGLVQSQAALPKAEIYPYAETVMPDTRGREELLQCIKKLDQLSAVAHV